MLLLVASLLALALGPALHQAAQKQRWTISLLDGFVLFAIVGFVVIHVIPEVLAEGGWGTLLVLAAGLVAPLFVERWLHNAARRVHFATLGLAVVGILLHAGLDGAVLGDAHGNTGLAMAVVLHRLPIALTVWALLAKPYGRGVATGALAVIGIGTVAGYFTGAHWLAGADATGLAYFEALVAGSLLHVVIHRPGQHTPHHHPGDRWKLAAGSGALLGLSLLAVTMNQMAHDTISHGAGHEHGHGDAYASAGGISESFISLALESAPALVFAYLAAGLVHVYLPKVGARWLAAGRPISQAARGVAFGLPLPMCSCGVIPVYRSLVMQGVPATAAMAFFVATPELGLDAIFLSVPLLGIEITLARVVAAFAIALLVGWGVGRMAGPPKVEIKPTTPEDVPKTRREQLSLAVRVGYGEMLDATMPWILLGLAIAALLDPILGGPDSILTRIPPGFEVIVFALLGMPAYVCASGATPLVAVLIAHGASPGAAIAFLMTGPATNVTTFGVLRELHGKRIAAAFGLAIALASVGAGLVVNLVLPNITAPASFHTHVDDVSVFRLVCALTLGLLVLVSLLRQGPREFVGHILAADDQDHSHDHEQGTPDPCCSHDHADHA